MTSVEKPDVVGAHRRAETIRNGMIGYAAAMEAIGEAYEARDWVALGYADWDTYCEKEFSEKRLRLTREQREQAVLAFRGAGMSTRAIAVALGVDPKTVRNDLAGGEFSPPAAVTGADGKTYSATKTSPGSAAPVDGAEGAAGGSGQAVPSDSPASTPADPPQSSDAAEEETRTGQGDRLEEDHPAVAPGDAAQDEVSVVPAESSGDETLPQDEAPRQSSSEVDKRQQERAGVSAPAAAPDLVKTPIGPMTREFAEALDRLVPDPNPHREWQSQFLKDVFAAAKAFRKYKGAEIAEKADEQLLEEFASLVADLDELQTAVAETQLAASRTNVVQLRSVQ